MSDYTTLMKQTYARRAETYDASSGSYHIALARDFVELVGPQPGEYVLDVASGTGLVAIDVAGRVGRAGKVVAVDWSVEMQRVGKEKARKLRGDEDGSGNGTAEIEWVLSDITSQKLLDEGPVRNVLQSHGGFDVITMCQGYMQLPDLQGAFTFWASKLLKPGGRMISDMTTEESSLQYLLTYHLPKTLNTTSLSSGRVYITNQADFESLFTNAGLDIMTTARTKLYGPEYWFEEDEESGLEVLQGEIERNLPWSPESGTVERAREVWPGIWREAVQVRGDGKRGVEGRHPFYFCVGRKPS